MLTFIITAGGIGKRMGGSIPKQFLLLNDKPILMHTIERMHSFDPSAELIVTLPEDYLKDWEEMCQKYSFNIHHEIVPGGKERFDSIKNALQKAKGDWIAVHDGVRPFVSRTVLNQLLEDVKKYRAVIPVIPVKETLRIADGESNATVNRDHYRVVQTPQVFEAKLIKKAYEQNYALTFTDDASVAEAIGARVHLIPGNDENIKITNPLDLSVAAIILKTWS
ncbi:MAG: 2-C-methyl-D-erythritol 4-phosphate cytidylyltransferase [Fluviicola sp.]|jgi:2-C-methyl-D-erythritol 4-phosphate cytidylyltransferase|uniref:2-C-methyl-D-erythritol 4-phosphate cytidylyltransferase n=1 Tax=Fluviicola sp. TaxID=1917219 RepID=UPI00260C3745|nr:2-C-methyl-D-erythritol 4-phosphate cytidylyltransferase [Fluviicola sp.]MDF3028020.1 2-C-methyl-D-erythritol 4-phosphate cytidylyltransferase [Fluviicola sp.]